MALQHRHYVASGTSRFDRALLRSVKALALVVVPVLRILCRWFPPLRRALARTTGARLGSVFASRDGGDHRAAYSAALEGMVRQERAAANDRRRDEVRDFHWWTFADLAAREAEHLTDHERAHVITLVDGASSPGGMLAAWCLGRIAGWRWRTGETDSALTYARRAVLADPSYPDGHVLLGWLGLVSGRFDPLPHLREAMRVDPSCAESIRADSEFAPGARPSSVAWTRDRPQQRVTDG